MKGIGRGPAFTRSSPTVYECCFLFWQLGFFVVSFVIRVAVSAFCILFFCLFVCLFVRPLSVFSLADRLVACFAALFVVRIHEHQHGGTQF